MPPYELDDKTIVKRMRLFCRASENLLLSDDVLNLLRLNWEKMVGVMEDWLLKYPDHPQYEDMRTFKTTGYDRLRCDVKNLRNVFLMLVGSQKPWEVAVGQAIAGLLSGNSLDGEHSLTAYLGPKLVDALNLRPPKTMFTRRTSRYT